jgi:hypothetical protein
MECPLTLVIKFVGSLTKLPKVAWNSPLTGFYQGLVAGGYRSWNIVGGS